MSAEFTSFVLLTALAFVFELVAVLVDRWVVNPRETPRERQLFAEAAKVRHESKKFEAPDTFVQFAKMGREANQLEIQADKLKLAREDAKKTPQGKLAVFVASYVLLPVSLAVAYVAWPGELAVLELPSNKWTWPLASALALPNQPPNGAVSSCGWMFLARRVLGRRVLELAM